MIRRAGSCLLPAILLAYTAASAQAQAPRFRNSPAPQKQAQPLFRAPAPQNSYRNSTAAHPRPVIVRMPAAPREHGGAAASSQAVSANGSLTTFPNDTVFSNTSFLNLNDLGPFLNTNTPGLGFDFSHLAALNRDLGVRAIIDPVTQHELALTEQLLQSEPVAAPAAFIPFAGSSYVEPEAYPQPQTPQIIVLQQPAQQTRPAAEGAAPLPAAAPEQPPLPPVGEFVLALRSGKQIKAVAFTHQGASIVYITNDGIRHSFPAADLDVSATEQLNQQHGTPLKLSL